jgi:hypothetical protein
MSIKATTVPVFASLLYRAVDSLFCRICWRAYEVQAKPFENVKNQIGYCGLWCGSCIVGNGTLRELTKKYEHLIRGYGVNEWGCKDFDSKEFMKGLESIQALPVCLGCLKGGGNDECKIRPCASKRQISDCSECDQSNICKNLETLQKVRTGARAVSMLIKTNNGNNSQLVKKWTTQIRNRFPHCVIDI